jgi:hypothetical protein
MTRLCLIVLLLIPTASVAQEVGRLFFTPEQRAALDARRRARVPDKPAAAVVMASPTTKLDGYVKRSGGPSTVWVNGEPLPEGAGDAPRIGPRVSVSVGEAGRRAALRPGEAIDRDTGQVRDVLGDGEIRIRREAR